MLLLQAIDFLAQQLMRKYNQREARVFTTVQAYLTDSHGRLLAEMERAHREGYKYGVKLVGGWGGRGKGGEGGQQKVVFARGGGRGGQQVNGSETSKCGAQSAGVQDRKSVV